MSVTLALNQASQPSWRKILLAWLMVGESILIVLLWPIAAYSVGLYLLLRDSKDFENDNIVLGGLVYAGVATLCAMVALSYGRAALGGWWYLLMAPYTLSAIVGGICLAILAYIFSFPDIDDRD